MTGPQPLDRGQGNVPWKTSQPVSAAKRGQTVPYDVNGKPQGPIAGALADGSYGDVTVSGTGTVFTVLRSPKLTTARSITMSGDVGWTVTFDGLANVTAAGTIQANAVTFAKLVAATAAGLVGATAAGNFAQLTPAQAKTVLAITASDVSGLAAVATAGTFTSLTGKPTTIAGYGITDAQGLNANLTAIAGLVTAADKMIFWTGSGAASLLSVTSANRTALSALSGTNTGDQTIILTGDATGSGTGSFAVTVVKINGVPLSGLATGILKNTTGIGAPSIAVAADFPTLNQNTTGSAATLTTTRNIDGQAFNGSADITVIAPGTHAATTKATPVDADELPLVDSAASNVLKKMTWANLKATLKTYLDTLYQVLNSNLTTIAGLTATTDNFIVSVSSAWASRTPAQVRTTLGLGTAALLDTGTSGAKVPRLDTANTWGSQQTVSQGLARSAPSVGHLEGSYTNIGANGAKSNPIYTIGSAFNPADAAITGMFGIGFSFSGSATFLSTWASLTAGWGLYGADGGVARWFLDSSNGVIGCTASFNVNGTKVIGARQTGWTAPTGTALKTGFDTATATTTQLAQTLKAVIDALVAHGSIGA